MSTTTKPKLTRTDYTICVCTNDRHDAVAHRRPASPTEPGPATVKRHPGGHVVERQIAWTPWKAKS